MFREACVSHSFHNVHGIFGPMSFRGGGGIGYGLGILAKGIERDTYPEAIAAVVTQPTGMFSCLCPILRTNETFMSQE